MLVLMMLAALMTAQSAGPADLFVGAWSQGPRHVMTEEDFARFDPCGCPVLIRRVDDRTIYVSEGAWGRGEYVVSRQGDLHHWTPLDGGETRVVRIEDGFLIRAYQPGLDVDWSRATSSRPCPLPEPARLHGDAPRQYLRCR